MTISFRIKPHHQRDMFFSGFFNDKNAAVFVVDKKRPKVWLHSGVHKSRTPNRQGDQIVYGGAHYLWVLSMERSSCHPSGV